VTLYLALRRKWPDLINQVDAFNSDDDSDGLGRGYESDYSPMADKDDFSKLGYKVKVPRPASAPGSVDGDRDEEREGFDVDEGEGDYEGVLRRTNSMIMIDLKALAVDGASRNASPATGVPSALNI
jgi:hypothetical protein